MNVAALEQAPLCQLKRDLAGHDFRTAPDGAGQGNAMTSDFRIRLGIAAVVCAVLVPGASVVDLAHSFDTSVTVGARHAAGSPFEHGVPRPATTTSTFDSDAEGWTGGSFPDGGPYDDVVGMTTPVWESDVGNPGGAIYIDDPDGYTFFFGAPAAFLGDKSSYYEGQLTYDLKSESSLQLYEDVDVVLLGGGLVLVYKSTTIASDAWTTFTVPLSESGWKVGTLGGNAPSAAQFQSALADITALRIRGEWRSGAPERGHLDNVSLLGLGVAPSVTTHPSNKAVTAGASASFSAAASGAPSPAVQWQVSAAGGSTWSNIAGAGSTTYSFTAAFADSGNQYRAVFTNSSGSAATNPATLTVAAAPFTDASLFVGGTSVRAVHVTELRTRISALRSRRGLGAYGWVDSTLAAGLPVRTVHIAELRTALQQVYEAAGRAAPAYTDPVLTPRQTAVKAIHVMELRAAVIALE